MGRLKTERLCKTCKEVKPVSAFPDARARRCDACWALRPPRGTRHCLSCGEHRPATEFASAVARRCASCVASDPTDRYCVTCKTRRPKDTFPNDQARRCTECWDAENAKACAYCGGPVPLLVSRTVARKVCDRDECQTRLHHELAVTANAKAMERTLTRKTKRCPCCGQRKPLTNEYWARRDHPKPSLRFDSYCKTCRVALQADRIRRRLGRPTLVPDRVGPRPDNDRMPTLPAGPLHAAVMRAAARHDGGLAGLCVTNGLEERSVSAWHPVTGDRSRVSFDTADRALLALDLLWFEVWEIGTPEGREAEAAFAGDVEAAAA